MYNSIIYNCLRLEAFKKPFNGKGDTNGLVHPHNEILHRTIKGQIIDTHNLNGSRMKQPSLQRLHTALFHLYNILEKSKTT